MTCGCDDPECQALRAPARYCVRCYHVIREVDLGPEYASWQMRLHLYCHACVKDFVDELSGARSRIRADQRRRTLARYVVTASLLLAVLALLAVWFPGNTP